MNLFDFLESYDGSAKNIRIDGDNIYDYIYNLGKKGYSNTEVTSFKITNEGDYFMLRVHVSIEDCANDASDACDASDSIKSSKENSPEKPVDMPVKTNIPDTSAPKTKKSKKKEKSENVILNESDDSEVEDNNTPEPPKESQKSEVTEDDLFGDDDPFGEDDPF